LALALLAAALFLGYFALPQEEGQTATGVSFAMCSRPPHTFYLEDVSIRVADIDTPETNQPQCSYEAGLGAQATRRMLELLNDGPIVLTMWDERDADQYGRKLRVVMRDGVSLGEILVAEGLARRWTGSRQPWCV
jgi:endonuclease YncB( thermonuclease family)